MYFNSSEMTSQMADLDLSFLLLNGQFVYSLNIYYDNYKGALNSKRTEVVHSKPMNKSICWNLLDGKDLMNYAND